MNTDGRGNRATKFAGMAAFGFAVYLAAAVPALADSTLKVDLWNKPDGSQGMTLGATEIKAGKVAFEITNSSTDMEHEFLLVRTDVSPDQLPMKDEGAKVDEGKLVGFDEFGDIEKGDTKTWNTELKPGKYVLFCNEEGHFKAGMYATLTVTP